MKPQLTSDIRILLADTDAAWCVSARRAFERLGWSVTIAQEGADLLERFSPDAFDVVVAAVSLPGVNRLQILHEIKEQSLDTQVILLCDASSVELAGEGLRGGAYAYLLTPMDDLTQLEHTIGRAIELQSLLRQVRAFKQTRAERAQTATSNAKPSRMLRRMIAATRTNKPLGDTLQLLLQSVVRLMETDHATILLSQKEVGLQLYAALGFDNQADAARDFVQHVGDAFAWRVAEQRKMLVDSAPASERQTPFKYIGVPMIAHDQVLGVLIVYPLPDKPLSAKRVFWLELLATQGALAVEFAHLRTEKEQLTSTDPVTGVLKQNVFMDAADREFRRSWRYNQPITLVLVDIDEMKDIVASGGRALRETVLRQVGNACRHVVRSIDLVGRYEGDSFVLLLLMADAEDARSVAGRLRASVSSIELTDARGRVEITATLGVCSYPRDGCTSIFDLLALARGAQAAARGSGTNQIVYA